VQDNSTCHTDMGFPLTIGTNCTIGHNVILHGCSIEDDALVTENGCEIITAETPKSVADIEALVGRD